MAQWGQPSPFAVWLLQADPTETETVAFSLNCHLGQDQDVFLIPKWYQDFKVRTGEAEVSKMRSDLGQPSQRLFSGCPLGARPKGRSASSRSSRSHHSS